MTGFGKSVLTLPGRKINIEIKSLNSKSMDLSTRIAPSYREKEIEIRSEIAQKLERGKVDFSLWIENETLNDVTPINKDVVKAYYDQIKAMSAEINIPEPNNWFDLLMKLPDVMTKNDIEEIPEEEWMQTHKAMEEAIGHLIEFRTQEGAALENKLREKVKNITEVFASIAPYEKERIDKIKARIIDELEKIPEVDYDKNRMEQEMIYYIEKLDINEEKQRLGNHLVYFIKTIEEEGTGKGKKLGFIAQEMGREINTLGSKSNHAEMQKIVVMMKDNLEQIKEQVLNVL